MVLPSIVQQDHYHGQITYGVKINDSIINVTVTSDPSVVYNWIYTTLFLRRDILYNYNLVVGLGVQWTVYSPEPFPPADILNLCVGRRCLIFQLSYAIGAPKILYDFLMNPHHTFVGFCNHSDRRKLESSFHNLTMFTDPLDLKHIAKTNLGKSLDHNSVNMIVRKTLGFRVNQTRKASMSVWDEQFLSNEQILYACVDTHCAFLIGTGCGAWKYNRYRNY